MLNRILRKFFCTLIFVASFYSGYSQDDSSDLNSWFVAAIEFEPAKKFKLGIETQVRLKEDISVVDQYFGEFNALYKLPYGFRIGGAFRYIRDNDTRGNIQGYENHIRYNFDISYRHKITRLQLRYRIRYQNRNELGISQNDGDVHREAVRFRTRFDYDFKNWKLDPIIAGELFNRFRARDYDNGFNKYRLTLGTNYKVKKIGRFSIAYLFENEFNIEDPRKFHIIKLGYLFEVKKK
ncbi:MAG: DUF2490 domain-containing protein [Flavobacteriaceae bacterium]|nr:DUF2490 domain-containing protein [Flavobacteriaceae bacterium]